MRLLTEAGRDATTATTTTTTSDARPDFADLCNRVAFGGERVIIERHGTARVAIVADMIVCIVS